MYVVTEDSLKTVFLGVILMLLSIVFLVGCLIVMMKRIFTRLHVIEMHVKVIADRSLIRKDNTNHDQA